MNWIPLLICAAAVIAFLLLIIVPLTMADPLGFKRRHLAVETERRKDKEANARFLKEMHLRPRTIYDTAGVEPRMQPRSTTAPSRSSAPADTSLSDPLNPLNPIGLLNPTSPISIYSHQPSAAPEPCTSSHSHTHHDSGSSSSSYSGSCDSGSSSSSSDCGSSSSSSCD